MTKSLRVKTGKAIDETYRISFKFNGSTYYGFKGDTLASALLANDVHLVGRSFKYHRRIILNNIDECYQTLGTIHKKWNCIPGKFKDYISSPKINGYKSIKISMLRIFLSLFLPNQSMANEASNWLKKEIDIILDAYKNENMSKETRFLMIEDTINYNFAGTGIAKFVAGDSWKNSDKETKKEYIKFFKRHLALNIASMMQGYSNETN